MRVRTALIAILSIALLTLSLSACGDDDAAKTTSSATEATTGADGDKGEIVKAELGENGEEYFVKVDPKKVKAGKVTFQATNVGEKYHEFIVYRNKDNIAPTALPINKENEAALNEADIIGEAPYATPPIVPEDKKPGDADHRIRSGGWGAELTVDLKPGNYILLCNLEDHYVTGQATAFTVE